IVVRQLAEARVADLGQLAFAAGAYPGAAGRVVGEEAHLAEELAAVEIGDHDLVAVLVLDDHRHGSADDQEQAVGSVARIHHRRLGDEVADVAMTHEPVEHRYLESADRFLGHVGEPFTMRQWTYATMIGVTEQSGDSCATYQV